jgi:ABC-type transporter Mla subunit MlaD
MDIAIAIFNIGAGLGVLAAGGALVYLVWQAAPLIREFRALTADLRRLARTADDELKPILAQTRELTGSVEVLSEDMAVKLDRLGDVINNLQAGLERGRVTAAAGRPEPRSVESWETREDGDR